MSENSSINLDKRAKRNREISIRVNDYELLELKKRNRGSTVASWLRDLALGVTPVKPVDPDLVRQLGRIGSNLNQLTPYVNTERQVDAQVLLEIKAIREQIHLLIESSKGPQKSERGGIMIVKFSNHGKVKASGVLNYPLKEKGSDGTLVPRNHAKVLYGDPVLTEHLIDTTMHKSKYKSGYLSFSESADEISEHV